MYVSQYDGLVPACSSHNQERMFSQIILPRKNIAQVARVPIKGLTVSGSGSSARPPEEQQTLSWRQSDSLKDFGIPLTILMCNICDVWFPALWLYPIVSFTKKSEISNY